MTSTGASRRRAAFAFARNASRLIGRIGRFVKRRVILTGTVMPHSPMNVFGQWRFLDPYAFGTQSGGVTKQATFGGFRGRFAIMGGYLGREYKGFVNLDDMQAVRARIDAREPRVAT